MNSRLPAKSEGGRSELITLERAETAHQEFEAIKTEKLQGLADGMAEAHTLQEKGLHQKAETLKQQTQDRFKPTLQKLCWTWASASPT